MPRFARKLSSTKVYHIMIRGVNKQEIFKDDFDRKKFLQIVKYYKKKYNINIYSYCLMLNHVHILIKDLDDKMCKFMKQTVGLYSQFYNKKNDRVGHLFQGRYKSEEVETKEYLLNVIRYIHKNPEKANFCKMQNYKWSSFKEYIFTEKIIDKSDILKIFHKNYKNSIALFEHFSYQEDSNIYLDIDNSSRRTDTEIKNEIQLIIPVDNLVKLDKSTRNAAIKQIKKIEGITNSQISRILGISRETIRDI